MLDFEDILPQEEIKDARHTIKVLKILQDNLRNLFRVPKRLDF